MSKIAIIEDSKSTNDEFKDIVLDLWPDCDVDQWYDVSTAISAILSTNYDIIISDIDLGPGADANGAVRIAQALDAKLTPLLIISGSPQPELQRTIYRALQAWDYLQKPISALDLQTQLERAMIVRKVLTGSIVGAFSVTSPDPNLIINNLDRRSVTWKGQKINLTITQFLLVELLLKNADTAVPYEQMFPIIPSGRNKENLRVHMGEIKAEFKSVDPEFECIKTKTMVGYSWIV